MTDDTTPRDEPIRLRFRVRWDADTALYRWADDDEPLTFDECETLELDGTGRTMAAWREVTR